MVLFSRWTKEGKIVKRIWFLSIMNSPFYFAILKTQQLTTWADMSLHLLLLNEKDITLDIKGDVKLFDLSYLSIRGTRRWIKKLPKSSISCPQKYLQQFSVKVPLFTAAQKCCSTFGQFLPEICPQELSKITQSGHK